MRGEDDLARVVQQALLALSGGEPGMVGRAHPIAEGRTSYAWRASLDGVDHIIRVPIPNSGRRLTYQAESRIGLDLASRGHPVATWTTVNVGGLPVSIGAMLAGTPIDGRDAWTDEFTRDFARLLADLHALDCRGWGPLQDTASQLIGTSTNEVSAVVDRWHHAPIWPFDTIDLWSHPLRDSAPDLIAAVEKHADAIRDAAVGRRGLVHSDLHSEHLLETSDGALAGVLDFGDAFIGSRAWDFALLIHYYGPDTAAAVAGWYGDPDIITDARELAIAVAVYKIAKNQGRQMDLNRLRTLVDGHERAPGS